MSVKEKLVEVLGEFCLWPSKMKHVWMPKGVENLADHLIANGVTVQDMKNGIVHPREIPMNPVRKYRAHYSDDYCPVCGKQQKTAKRSMKKPWYCERCGQKLGWDGVE